MDRIEVERAFSLSKRCYGMGLIRTKLYDTTLTSIALSVFVTNLFKIQSRILFTFLWLLELFIIPENGAKVSKIKCLRLNQQTLFSESPHTFKSSFNNCFPETPLYSLSNVPSGPPCIPETIEISPED